MVGDEIPSKMKSMHTVWYSRQGRMADSMLKDVEVEEFLRLIFGVSR